MDEKAGYGVGRRVSIRLDGEDFVIAYQPEDFVVFRGKDLEAMRKVCRFFEWNVISDLPRFAS